MFHMRHEIKSFIFEITWFSGLIWDEKSVVIIKFDDFLDSRPKSDQKFKKIGLSP